MYKHVEGVKKPYVRIGVFVDWNSQLLIYGGDEGDDPVSRAAQAFKMMTRKVSSCLARLFPDERFTVSLRFYHGWHKGYEPTANRKAIERVISEVDFAVLSDKPSVIFSPEIGYGDRLISALPERIHRRPPIHLPNTVRDRGYKGLEEKMVDTALASDVIVSAYQEPDEWIVIVSEDDDFVPPIFVAESIIIQRSSRALLLSSKVKSSNLLKLDRISVV